MHRGRGEDSQENGEEGKGMRREEKRLRGEKLGCFGRKENKRGMKKLDPREVIVDIDIGVLTMLMLKLNSTGDGLPKSTPSHLTPPSP